VKSFCLSLAIPVIFLLTQVHLNAAVEPLKACAAEPADTLLVYGDIVGGPSCEITPVTDVDTFKFTGSTGEIVRVIGIRGGGDGFCLDVRDPDGIQIPPSQCTFAQTLQLELTLTKTGIHSVIVTEANNNQTMTYSLAVNRTFPSAGSPTIDFGQILSDDLDPVVDQDTYRFSGTMGDVIRIVGLRGAGGDGICLDVRDPDYSPVPPSQCTFAQTLQLDIVLAKTGVYSLIVSEANNNQTNPYTVSLTCINGACGPKLPVCDVSATYSAGTLNLNFTLRSVQAVQWGVWASIFDNSIPLWSLPVVLDPQGSFPLAVPAFPSIGTIGFLSTFANASGVVCSDYATVNTGNPAAGARSITPEQLRRLIQLRR
jgi:hypothetical protein